jgi:hypothetical protein
MGKRELLIATGFIVAAILAYRLTASPVPAGQGFSFSRLIDSARRGVQGHNASVRTTVPGTVSAPLTLVELRITGITEEIKVVGEARSDIAYDLTINSTGPDEATALAYAQKTVLAQDDMGDTLSLRAEYPDEGTQRTTLSVHVPLRLKVRIDGGTISRADIEAMDLAALQVEGVSGDVVAGRIKGLVSGTQRSGDFKVDGAGSVRITLQNSRAEFANVTRGLSIDVRSGACKVTGSGGPLELDQQRSEITIVDHRGPMRISGTYGSVLLDGPQGAARVDVRHCSVEARVHAPVPLTLLTTDEPLRLVLDAAPAIAINAIATEGRIDAADFGWQVESSDHESRFSRTLGPADAPRVTLRNARADIVIGKRK